MRGFQCLALCIQGAFSGGGDDFASAFNKAFFDQLQGADQAQVIEMVPRGSPPRGREAELDQQLQKMVGNPGYTVEFVNEDAAVPAESIRQLFPGPLQFDLMDGRAQPIREPDPLVMDMLSSVNNMVQEVVAPELHKMQHASAAPDSCQKDAVAHCSTARSQVHCLGQHRADISEDCRRDLGKSVPFVCSAAIDQHCDVLHVGILDCLQKYQEELFGDCKDAFLATSKVIQSLNSAVQAPKAATAATAVPTIMPVKATPSLLATPLPSQPAQALLGTKPSVVLADRERNLDSQLAKLAGVKLKEAPSIASAIQQAEKQAEDQLVHDADKIESLLSQMSNKISKSTPMPLHSGHSGPSFSVMLFVTIFLLVAYFYFQSDSGRKAWLKLRMMLYNGRPLLKKGLDRPFGDEEVPL